MGAGVKDREENVGCNEHATEDLLFKLQYLFTIQWEKCWVLSRYVLTEKNYE